MSTSTPWSRKRKAREKSLKMLAAKTKSMSGDCADDGAVGSAPGATMMASS